MFKTSVVSLTGTGVYFCALVAVCALIDHVAAHKCLLSLVYATVIMIYIVDYFCMKLSFMIALIALFMRDRFSI